MAVAMQRLSALLNLVVLMTLALTTRLCNADASKNRALECPAARGALCALNVCPTVVC